MVWCGCLVVALLSWILLLQRTAAGETIDRLRGEIAELRAAHERDRALLHEILAIESGSELRRELGTLVSVLTSLRSDLTAGNVAALGKEDKDFRTLVQAELEKRAEEQRALQDALRVSRSELRELAAAIDVPTRLRDQHNTKAGLARLAKDLTDLEGEIAALRADQQRNAASATQMQADLAECKSRIADLYSDKQRVFTQIQDLQDEVRQNSYLLTMPKPPTHPHPKKRSIYPDRQPRSIYMRHSGHHHLKKEVDHLKKQFDEMEKKHEQLQTELLLLKKQERGLEDQVEEKLPLSQLQLSEVSNVSAITKLHASTVQLFEALEKLEDKLNKNVGIIQKEVSKVEANAATTQTTIEELKEDVSEQNELVKSQKRVLEVLQEKSTNMTLWIAKLETDFAIRTAEECMEKSDEYFQNAKINELEDRISNISQRSVPKNNVLTDEFFHLNLKLEKLKEDNDKLNQDVTLLIKQLPKDCSNRDAKTSGVALVHIPGITTTVFCDEEWTVIQRRVDDSETFDRNWNEYKRGFGDRSKNFWIGNDFLHLLTHSGNYSLRVDMWDTTGQYRYAQYSKFLVSGEEDRYCLHLGGFQGNASDALAYHNQMNFSTSDRDSDQSATNNCALYYGSGWWYNQCQYVNLNGHYTRGITWFDREAHEWLQLGKSEMKVKPR